MRRRDSHERHWRKSAASAQGNCVEVSLGPDEVLVRDSKAPDGPVLYFSPHAWAEFISFITRENGS